MSIVRTNRHRLLLHDVAARGRSVQACPKISENSPAATPKLGSGPLFEKTPCKQYEPLQMPERLAK